MQTQYQNSLNAETQNGAQTGRNASPYTLRPNPSRRAGFRGAAQWGSILLTLTALVTVTVTLIAFLILEPPALAARLRDYPGDLQASLLWRSVQPPTPVVLKPVQAVTKRVQEAGGQRGDVELTLTWDTEDDLDFHLLTPEGKHLSYSNKGSATGIHLDVDVINDRKRAVEHFVVPQRSQLKPGIYQLSVKHYAAHAAHPLDEVNFVVTIQGARSGNTVQADTWGVMQIHGAAKRDKPAGFVCNLMVGANSEIVVQTNPTPPPVITF